MSRPLRLEFPGSLWHVTGRGNERRRIFLDDSDRSAFLDDLGACVERFDWILPTYSLMPNHFHLEVQLRAKTLSSGMHWLNGKYARNFNSRHGRVGHLFQGRFHGILIDKETYGLEVLRYVVLNPVRAGMVARPENYRWSSHQAILGLVRAPKWLAVDDVLAQFGPTRPEALRRYGEFVNAGIGSSRKPWDDVVGQIYLGSDDWLEEIKQEIALKPRASEHPKTQRMFDGLSMAEVVAAVAEALAIDEDWVRGGHGGFPRMIAAWIASRDGYLSNTQIAAGLRLRSASHVSALVRSCDQELSRNVAVRHHVETCISTIRRKNHRPQT